MRRFWLLPVAGLVLLGAVTLAGEARVPVFKKVDADVIVYGGTAGGVIAAVPP
jgi:hypothetical protein